MLSIHQKEDKTDWKRVWLLIRVSEKIIIFLLWWQEQFYSLWLCKLCLGRHIHFVLSRSTKLICATSQIHIKSSLLLRASGGSKSTGRSETKTLWYSPKMSLSLIVFTVWNGEKKRMRSGQRKEGLSISHQLVMWDSKGRIERWENWIEDLRWTKGNRMGGGVRHFEEISKGYKEQMNRSRRKSKTITWSSKPSVNEWKLNIKWQQERHLALYLCQAGTFKHHLSI